MAFREDIVLLRVSGLDGLRARRHGGAGVRSSEIDERRMEHVYHGEENQIQRFLCRFDGEEVVYVCNSDLSREARIDGATGPARAIEFRAGVVRIHEILGLQTQALEVSVE